MTSSGLARDDVPDWFWRAIDQQPAQGHIDVGGHRIATLRWGAEADPAIVLVHGGAAHAWWWGFVAPLLATEYHVVALDLSGHGDSDHRPAYSFRTWAAEVAAVAATAGDRPVLVGHSMGGVVAAVASPMVEGIAGVVMVDAPLGAPDREAIGDSEAVFQRVRHSPDRDALVARFRPLPEQPVEHPALVAYVGELSVREHHEGWAWKFDPRAFAVPARDRPDDAATAAEVAGCPLAAIVGGASPVVPAADRLRLRRLAGDEAYVELPGGHHHLMFDHPRTLAEELGRLAGLLRSR